MNATPTRNPYRAAQWGALCLLAVASPAVWAHVGEHAGGHHGFLSGFLHPVTGLDHLAAMVAVGIWSAVSTRRIWLAPLTFALLLLSGALLASAGLAFPAIEPMIAASMLVVGLLLAVKVRLAEPLIAGIVGTFAVFHGAAHGQELNGGLALAGMVVGTACLHAAGILAGRGLERAHVWLPRLTGGAVALLGLNMGWTLISG